MATAETFRWDETSFVRAWEAGIFDGGRYELVDGEALRVVIGPWHGQVTMQVGRLLPGDGWRITNATLPAAGSLPDPDVFVFRRGAAPVDDAASPRIQHWEPTDVGLVVEVADSSWDLDTRVKSRLYGSSGYPAYWVVHRAGVEVFTEPASTGYRLQRSVGIADSVEVPYAPGTFIAVADLLDIDE